MPATNKKPSFAGDNAYPEVRTPGTTSPANTAVTVEALVNVAGTLAEHARYVPGEHQLQPGAVRSSSASPSPREGTQEV